MTSETSEQAWAMTTSLLPKACGSRVKMYPGSCAVPVCLLYAATALSCFPCWCVDFGHRKRVEFFGRERPRWVRRPGLWNGGELEVACGLLGAPAELFV